MDLPTYTNIWRIEKRLYKLYDVRLPAPLPINLIVVFAGITIPYIFILYMIGVPLSHTLVWLYVLPPGVLTWLTTRPVIEGKRLPELVESQVRYLAEPRTWCRLAPFEEKDQVVINARVWHSRRAIQPDTQEAADTQEATETQEAVETAEAPSAAPRMRGRLLRRDELTRRHDPALGAGAPGQGASEPSASATGASAGAPRTVPDAGLSIVVSDAASVASREPAAPASSAPASAAGKSREDGKAARSGTGRPTRLRPAVFRPGGRARGRDDKPALPGTGPDPETLAGRPVGRAPSLPSAPSAPPAAAPTPFSQVPVAPWPTQAPAPAPATSGSPPAPWPSADPAPSDPAPRPSAPASRPGASGPPTWPSAPAGALPGIARRPAPPAPLGRAAAPVSVTLPPHATPDVHPAGVPVREEREEKPTRTDAVPAVAEKTTRTDAVPVVAEKPTRTDGAVPVRADRAAEDAREARAAEATSPDAAPVRARGGGAPRLEVSHNEAAGRPAAPKPVPARTWPFPPAPPRPVTPPAPQPPVSTAPPAAPAEPPAELKPAASAPAPSAAAPVVQPDSRPAADSGRPLGPVIPLKPAAPEGPVIPSRSAAPAGPVVPVPEKDRSREPEKERPREPEKGRSGKKDETGQEPPRRRINPIATALAVISDGPLLGTSSSAPAAETRTPAAETPPPAPAPAAETPAPAPAAAGPVASAPEARTSAPAARPVGPATGKGGGSGSGTGLPVTPSKAPEGTPTIERALSGKSRDRNLSWRGTVKVVTGKTQGPGARDQEALDRARARLPLKSAKRVLMLGCTSGAGQTVTTLMTGHILASLRDEPVAAVDLNDGGLARFTAPAARLDEVLKGQPPQRHTNPRPDGLNPNARDSQARLDVIASQSSLVDGDELKMAVQLGRHYPLTMLDPGAQGLTRLLKVADQLVIVVPASVEAAGALADTREWLDAHGFGELVAHSVTLVNGVSRRSLADVEAAESVARGRCRAIVRVPWDEMLPVGVAGPSTLRPQTRVAYTALAGVLVAGMAAAPVRTKK